MAVATIRLLIGLGLTLCESLSAGLLLCGNAMASHKFKIGQTVYS
jgi:hypothetical protein